MIRRMFRKILAALLIVGWTILSGFDLVEDLEEIAGGQVAVSHTSSEGSSTRKLVRWGTIANNTVESAQDVAKADIGLFSFSRITFGPDTVLDCRRHFPLHKLYRV